MHTSPLARRAAVSLCVFGAALVSIAPVHAQPGTWIGGNGNWSDAANWFGGDVPNTNTEDASITNGSAVTINGNFTLGGLTLGAGDTLTAPTFGRLNLNGDFVNAGLYTLDGTNGGTPLNTEADTTFASGGELVIGANGGNTGINVIGKFTGAPSVTITNAADHTIRATGKGSIGRSTTILHNAGLIVADGAAAEFVVQPIASSPFMNSGTLRAQNSGVLRLSNGGIITLNNAGGTLNTTAGGTIELFATNITGGTLDGDIQAVTGSSITGLINLGGLVINNAVPLQTNGNIVNDGSITLAGTVNGTFLGAATDTVYTGTGEVLIDNTGSNINVNRVGAASGSGQTITNTAGHTFRATGKGQIGGGTAIIHNAGLVLADGPSAELNLNALATGAFNNTGTLRADGGTLRFINTIDNSGGGVIQTVNGGSIELQQANVIGGTLSGNVAMTVSSTLKNMTNNTSIVIPSSQQLGLSGTIVNNGTLSLESAGGGTVLGVIDDAVLTGTGEVLVATTGSNSIGASVLNKTLTNGPGHTIRVTGTADLGRSTTRIVNQGTILVDGQGTFNAAQLTLASTGGGGVSNAGGTIRVIDGGVLSVNASSPIIIDGGTLEVLNNSRLQRASGNAQRTFTGNVTAGTTIRVVDSTLLGADTNVVDHDLASSAGVLEFNNASTDLFNNIFPFAQPGNIALLSAGISSANDLRSDQFATNTGDFRIGGGLNFTTSGQGNGAANEFLNTGTITTENGSAFTAASLNSVNINGNDRIITDVGDFRSTGTLAGTGTFGAIFAPQVGTGGINIAFSATDAAHPSLVSQGTIAPGDQPEETGTLTLVADQDIVLADSHRFDFELGGTGAGAFDRVEMIAGTLGATPVALNGRLDVSLVNGFTPQVGDAFEILSDLTGGLTGKFDSAFLPGTVSGAVWSINYGPNAVTLEVLAGFNGDYNDSGQVEQGDLDLVLANWGVDTNVAGTPAGWINDLPVGLIEQTELDKVLQRWGSTTAPDFRSRGVPEPTVSAVLVLLTSAFRRRRA